MIVSGRTSESESIIIRIRPVPGLHVLRTANIRQQKQKTQVNSQLLISYLISNVSKSRDSVVIPLLYAEESENVYGILYS
jgi:hypothetical protein